MSQGKRRKNGKAATKSSHHLHLLGRSPHATSPDVKWGQAPKFPDYANRLAWTGKHELLNVEECRQIIARTKDLLVSKYGFSANV